MQKALLIFIKNPQKGKVKTRLAATIGEEKALEIYQELMDYTRTICEDVDTDRLLFYSQHIDTKDKWKTSTFRKFVQEGKDLGQRMKQAFETAFDRYQYQQVIIIGSDCAELTSTQINTAFEQLKTHDVVIGPARDGGYYLLGMNQFLPSIFDNKTWSTPNLLKETLTDLDTQKHSYHFLPELNDIDTEADWLEVKDKF